MKTWLIKIIIWLLSAVIISACVGIYASNARINNLQTELSTAVTWDIAQKINWLEMTKKRMWELKADIETTTALKAEIDQVLEDQHINYWLLQETANIFKDEIKDVWWLN